VPKAVILVMPSASRTEAGKGGYVSNMIYQKHRVIRLINVSDR
jgi:hypothetical protein